MTLVAYGKLWTLPSKHQHHHFYQFLKILMRGGGPNYIQEIESVHHI